MVAALAALALVTLMVLRTSSAAFSGTTEHAGNSWSAGTVTLTDDGGTAWISTAAADQTWAFRHHGDAGGRHRQRRPG